MILYSRIVLFYVVEETNHRVRVMLSVSQLQVVLYIFYNKILKETIFRFVMMFDRKQSVQRRSAISFSFSQKILFIMCVY
jgi:hypothetical protein